MAWARPLSSAILCMFALVAGLRHRAPPSNVGALRVKVYYINMDDSTERNSCLKNQLLSLQGKALSHGIHIVAERFSAVTFSDKCQDTASCIKDQPSCFPSKQGFASHGGISDAENDSARVLHGVFGDACSHYKVLQKMTKEIDTFDYFLVLEDDVGIDDGVLENLAKLFKYFPNYWSMITIDSFMWPQRKVPPCDVIPGSIRRGLPLGGISSTKSTNWGSQAWLFNSKNVPLFVRFYERMPTMNVDWYTKVPRPLHLGMWSFTPGQMQQMRFIGSDLQARLPASCGGEGVIESDIGEIALFDSDLLHQNVLPESSSPRELLIFGMEGSGAEWVQALVHETIEKPQGVVLCDWKAGFGCGGVSMATSPWNWENRLSKARSLSNAVAVVVVRHPFAMAEELQRNGKDVHTYCSVLGCDTTCRASGMMSAAPCHWSSYAKALDSISGSGPFHKILVLRFEDIWQFPHTHLNEIARLAGTGLPGPVTEAQLKAAGRGLPKKPISLDSLTYKNTWQCSKLDAMCKHIDQGHLWKYGYHGCQLYWKDYTDQVFHDSGSKKSYFMDCVSFNDTWTYW